MSGMITLYSKCPDCTTRDAEIERLKEILGRIQDEAESTVDEERQEKNYLSTHYNHNCFAAGVASHARDVLRLLMEIKE